MRWMVFGIAAFGFLVLEVSFRGVLEVRSLGLAPSFVPIVAVFVCLFAPRSTALWACWVLGLLVDLCTYLPDGEPVDRVMPLVGPHALGFVLAGFLVLKARPVLLRGKVLTLAVMTVMAVAVIGVVVIAFGLVHELYPQEQLHWADLHPMTELARRVGVAVYSGLLALLIGPALAWTGPVWAFRGHAPRHGSWR